MAEVVWSEPALGDLDAIADYVALENVEAAKRLVQRIFKHVDLLQDHPELGSKPSEPEAWRYRQISEPPCRIFYRKEGGTIYVVHVMRGERLLRPEDLERDA